MNEEYYDIEARDMTRLFVKEMFIYSLGDWSLPVPTSLNSILYWLLFSAVWSLPLGMSITWNKWTTTLILGPPILFAIILTKPIFGGKKFPSWIKCQIKYALSPKHYYDGVGIKKLEQTYEVEHYYTVSRRKDYYKLFKKIEESRQVNEQ